MSYAARLCITSVCLLAGVTVLCAQQNREIHGTVKDPLGALVPAASVELVRASTVLASTRTDARGSFAFALAPCAGCELRVRASSFEPTMIAAADQVEVTLATQTYTQQITVAETGTPTPLAQSGAPVSVLTEDVYSQELEVQDALRLVPGVQATANGQLGGVTSLFLRGGNSDFTKVLIDGVPVNDIGAAADLSTLASTGISQIEVLRQPSTVLYGSDVESGVVSLTTSRGTTPLPLFTYAVEGGNLGTVRQQAAISGARSHFDYETGMGVLETSNQTPNDQFHSTTSFGNYGFDPGGHTDLRLTFRHIDTNSGVPNAIAFFGLPDLVNQFYQETFLGAAAQQQTTSNWHSAVRYGWQALNYDHVQYAASGVFDPDLGATLGNVVTIRGANGYSVTGQAQFDYPSDAYPASSASTTRRGFLNAETDYRFNQYLTALGSLQFEAEDGKSAYASADRGNYSYTLQGSGNAANRLFYVAGTGIEDNAVYGRALTPRTSVAYYAVRPQTSQFFSGTKLHASFGKGIEEPSVSEQLNVLAVPLGGRPLGGQYSRTYDAGVEQQLGDGRARVNLSWFHNQFSNVIEYVPPIGLVDLGAPQSILSDPNVYGDYTNSLAFRAEGAEIESEFRITRKIFARGGYTYLDARVQRSFSSDALQPSYNTSFDFGNIPIGNYSPLSGSRPFRRAPHTGYFSLQYAGDRVTARLSGTLVGRRDDSTYLGGADPSYGNSLLLPNRNLDGSYQQLELSCDYRINAHVSAYAHLQNLLNEGYFEAFGYPALPLTVRSGIKVSFGGESFHLR